MQTNFVVVLVLSLCAMQNTYGVSSVISSKIQSPDALAAITKVAEVLNVLAPGKISSYNHSNLHCMNESTIFYFLDNWLVYMTPTVTNGSSGEVQVGNSTLTTAMRSWSIPQQFHNDAIQTVRSFIVGVTEGSFISQAYTFENETRNFLTTLLLAAKKIKKPSRPDLPASLSYVTINTNTEIKQQCNVCSTWFGSLLLSGCSPRENTPEEWNYIKQKMKSDQYSWFKQKIIPTTTVGTLAKRSI